jgi:hypothetical protein
MNRFGFRAVVGTITALTVATLAPAHAARVARIPFGPVSAYAYEGIVYSRILSPSFQPRATGRIFEAHQNPRPLAAPAYAITSLVSVVEDATGTKPLSAEPTAVNDAGHIALVDDCDCIGEVNNNAAIVINDTGTYVNWLYADPGYNDDNAIPFAINDAELSAGQWEETYGGYIRDAAEFVGNIAWGAGGQVIYYGAADYGSTALAINSSGVSVGQDANGPRGTFAAAYSEGTSRMNRFLLKPPKNTHWIGVATGINDAGEIVGYATFPGGGRAVRYYVNGYAPCFPSARRA